jgi:hypothetical protein
VASTPKRHAVVVAAEDDQRSFTGTASVATPNMATASTSTALPAVDFRTLAVVEDLQLSPALCLPPDAPVERAIGEALMRDFTIVPICEHRRAVGYLDVPEVQRALERGEITPAEPISKTMRHFERSKPYTGARARFPLPSR